MVGNVFKATFGYECKGEWCETGVYFKEAVGSGDPIPTRDLVVAVANGWVSTVLATFASDFVLNSIYARLIVGPIGIPSTFVIDSPGLRPAESIGPQCGVVITQYARSSFIVSHVLRRSNQWAGVSEADQVNGILTKASYVRWRELAALYLVNVLGPKGGVWRPCCVSKLGQEFIPIETAYVQPVLSTRKTRRRHRGLGPS